MRFFYFFFFFQAEDGIRDYKVTGVQTCALPISAQCLPAVPRQQPEQSPSAGPVPRYIRSEERREGKSVDLGGRRIIKKNTRMVPEAELEQPEAGRVPASAGWFGRNARVFFSSRRRHTRLQGDWSSDVCSSD